MAVITYSITAHWGQERARVLNRARSIATSHCHKYFTLEHLLWVLLFEDEAQAVFIQAGFDIEHLRRGVIDYVNELYCPEIEYPFESLPTIRVRLVDERARFYAERRECKTVRVSDIVQALFREVEVTPKVGSFFTLDLLRREVDEKEVL